MNGLIKGVRSNVSQVAGTIASALVRKSVPGIVVLADERVEVMRWIFHWSFNPDIYGEPVVIHSGENRAAKPPRGASSSFSP